MAGGKAEKKGGRGYHGPQSEIELQRRALAELGDDFIFPLFNGRQAIESQRKSAYKNTACAAREIADNSYEAGAKNVWVVFRRPAEKGRKKSQRRDAVTAIAFIDNGPGMLSNMARYALSWGGGTRFDNPTGIGRFGFGLPNASINQTRRVEVYTRTLEDKTWSLVTLDITPERLHKIQATGLVTVDAPVRAELPSFVGDFLTANKVRLKSGVVVVWEKPDRLSARSSSKLRELMLDDFGVVYRGLLDDFSISVDGVEVEKVDPFFLTPGARYYLSEDEGGATCTYSRNIPVKYFRDPETGAQRLRRISSTEEAQEARGEDEAAVGTVSVKIARFPYGFAAERVRDEMGREKTVPKDSESYKRLQIRKNRRGVSYVRSGREIDFVDNLPRRASDKASGLGDWPVLESYAMHWGIEVRFNPNLDEAFGMGNDKQTVNPIEDFWRLLHDEEVDRASRTEEQEQRTTRSRKQAEESKYQADNPDQPNPATEAASEAEAAMGRAKALPQERAEESQQRFQETVQRRMEETHRPEVEVIKALEEEAKRKRYAIGFFRSEGGVFYRPDFGNGMQRVAQINVAHPFFTGLYSRLGTLPDPHARQTVDVLLLALAKAELEADANLKHVYEHQREAEWSPFLKLALDILYEISPDAAESSGGA